MVVGYLCRKKNSPETIRRNCFKKKKKKMEMEIRYITDRPTRINVFLYTCDANVFRSVFKADRAERRV